MRNLLAGRRGHDYGPSLVREGWRNYGPCRCRERAAVCTLLTNQSDRLLASLERSDSGNVRRFAGHVDGLPQYSQETLQRGAAAYTELWSRKLREAKAAGIAV